MNAEINIHEETQSDQTLAFVFMYILCCNICWYVGSRVFALDEVVVLDIVSSVSS